MRSGLNYIAGLLFKSLNAGTQYDKEMIEQYKNQIQYETLTIKKNLKLKSLDFIQTFNINRLIIQDCNNIIPKLESKTIKQLQLFYCDIISVNDFRLDNLEVLEILNLSKIQSNTLIQEIFRFQKLKELCLVEWIVDINLLSHITSLTKLTLYDCDLRDTKTLRYLVNLLELDLSSNQDINTISLQYLTQLTSLWLQSCCLVNLDFLRPLIKLKYLDVYDNSIIYLQPLFELKELSELGARKNFIIDCQAIQQHLNFLNLDLNNQEQPTKEQLKVADTMRDINNLVIHLKQLCKQSGIVKQQGIKFRLKISESLQKQLTKHMQFIERATYLFQQANPFDGYQ
ncbi:leucine-rich_repeat domain-containing protein [Hexamita inflata]|uniref:Leucine-rich repeat domain-containing protein n=1 Tax=Hexamita inflata TaxID=28002 RepID=A0AA86VKR1_9EUKA|nr:leucine-rich repeat domain-containing protein [Hexamita inflata]